MVGSSVVSAKMQDLAHRLGLVEFGRMRLGDQHDAGIALVLVDRDHLRGRAERKHQAEARDRRVRRHGAHIGAHHAPHR